MTTNEYQLSISIEKEQEKFSSKMATFKSFLVNNGFIIVNKEDNEDWLDMTVKKLGTESELVNKTQAILTKMKNDLFRIDIVLKQHKPSILLTDFNSSEFTNLMIAEESKIYRVSNDKQGSYTLYYPTSELRDSSLESIRNEFPNKKDNIIKYWDDTILFEGNSFTEKKKLNLG